MNPQDLSESDIENLLRSLPLYERAKDKEKLFYARLRELAARKEEEFEAEKSRFAFFSGFRHAFAFASVAVILLFVATIGFSLSPKVTRGHFLYGVKRAEEGVELAFARAPLSRVNTHLRFASRRLDELEELFKGNPELFRLVSLAHAHLEDSELDPRIHETLHDYYAENTKAAKEIVKIEEVPVVTKALEAIERTQEKHVEKLENLLPKVAEVAKPVIVEVITVVEEHQTEVIEKKVEVARKQGEGKEKVVISLTPIEVVVEKIKEKPLTLIETERAVREEKAKEELGKAKERFLGIQAALEEVVKEPKVTLSPEVSRLPSFMEEKLREAEEAFDGGDFTKVRGLSKALETFSEEFHREYGVVKKEIEMKKREIEIMETFHKRKEEEEAKRRLEKETKETEEIQKKQPEGGKEKEEPSKEEPRKEEFGPRVYTPQLLYRSPQDTGKKLLFPETTVSERVTPTSDATISEPNRNPEEEERRKTLITRIQKLTQEHESPKHPFNSSEFEKKTTSELQYIYRMLLEMPKEKMTEEHVYPQKYDGMMKMPQNY